MTEQVLDNWNQKASDYLSAGFTRSESIKMLSEDGLNIQDATSVVDHLVQTSYRQGLKELGIGVLILIGGILWWIFLSKGVHDILGEKVGGGICVVGLFMIGDGIRRLASLRIVTKK